MNQRALLAVVLSVAVSQVSGATAAADCGVKISPLYYPTEGYEPEIPLSGKVAVVAGASRGIGRGAALRLHRAGVTVIGTSRWPEEHEGKLPFEMRRLDVSDPASVDAFVQDLLRSPAVVSRGGIDILVLNPGRFVLGRPVPRPGAEAMFESGLELSIATILAGNARLANSLLPSLEARHRASGYARLLLTVSPIGYYTGGTEPMSVFFWAYSSIKRAYLAWANSLRAALAARGSGVLVSTINPQVRL